MEDIVVNMKSVQIAASIHENDPNNVDQMNNISTNIAKHCFFLQHNEQMKIVKRQTIQIYIVYK